MVEVVEGIEADMAACEATNIALQATVSYGAVSVSLASGQTL